MTLIQHQKFLLKYKKYYSCYQTISYSKLLNQAQPIVSRSIFCFQQKTKLGKRWGGIQHLNSFNFILNNFQFLMKSSKTQKMYSPFRYFLLSNSLKKNIVMSSQSIHQIDFSLYCFGDLSFNKYCLLNLWLADIQRAPMFFSTSVLHRRVCFSNLGQVGYRRIDKFRSKSKQIDHILDIPKYGCLMGVSTARLKYIFAKKWSPTIKNTQLKNSFFYKHAFLIKNLHFQNYQLRALTFKPLNKSKTQSIFGLAIFVSRFINKQALAQKINVSIGFSVNKCLSIVNKREIFYSAFNILKAPINKNSFVLKSLFFNTTTKIYLYKNTNIVKKQIIISRNFQYKHSYFGISKIWYRYFYAINSYLTNSRETTFKLKKQGVLNRGFYKTFYMFKIQAFAFKALMFYTRLWSNTHGLFVSSYETNKVYDQICNYKFSITIQNFIIPINKTHIHILTKRQRFIGNSLKGILLVNFPEKEKNFLIKNLAAENKIALITQSASLLLKDSRNMDDLLGVDDPIQILFDKVKTCIPCICFINNLDRIGKQRYEQEQKSLHWLNNSISLLVNSHFIDHNIFRTINKQKNFDLPITTLSNKTPVFSNRPINKMLRHTKEFVKWPADISLIEGFPPSAYMNRFMLSQNWVKNTDNEKQTLQQFSFKNWLSMQNKSAFFKREFTLFFKKFKNNYYHRLPFWLSKNYFPPSYKTGIKEIKLSDSYYNRKTQKENILNSLSSKVNYLPLKMTIFQVLSNTLVAPKPDAKTNSIFSKSDYKIVDDKTHFENLHKIFSQSIFKNSLIKSNNTEMFKNKLKPFSKINTYYVTSSQKKLDFKNLGKIPSNKKKNFKIYLDSKKQSISVENSVWPEISLIEKSFKNQNESMFKNMSINQQKPKTSKFLSSIEEEPNDSLQLTETDIIKRTALLKFLQILDGFHTTTRKRKSISFPYLNLFNWEFKTKNASVLKPAKLKIDNKSSLSIKNFLTPLVLVKEPKNYAKTIMINSIQNNLWFPKINRLKRPKETEKYSMHGTVMFSKPKNKFLNDFSQKKNRSLISFTNQALIPKWEIYLKNQPVLKSLNLLCVWPSYIEDMLGSFNLNDGASYLLPEYFQLLGHGPKLKKQGITLIASTNNLTTLDAALLRPGRFDTIINFFHSSLTINKSYEILKHSASLGSNSSLRLKSKDQWNLTQDNKFFLFKSSIKEKKMIDFSFWPSNIDKKSIAIKKQKKNSLFFLEKNIKFLFNNAIWIPSIYLINRFKEPVIFNDKYPLTSHLPFKVDVMHIDSSLWAEGQKKTWVLKKAIQNQFSSQVTVLDIPSQSIPIKTFIDVSVFIQYKVWWSFNNGKLSWLRLYEKSLIQKQKTRILDSEKFKIFKGPAEKLNTYNVGIILKSKIHKIKDLSTRVFFTPVFQINTSDSSIRSLNKTGGCLFFMSALRILCFNFFYNFFQLIKFQIVSFKVLIQNFRTNRPKFITKTETSINQNFNSLNILGREILISKATTFKLPKNLDSLDNFLTQNSIIKKKSWSLANQKTSILSNFSINKISGYINTEKQALKKSFIRKRKTTFEESKNKIKQPSTIPSFKSNFHIQYDSMFLKYNRSLLFCTGDFDYKTYSKKDSDVILIKTKLRKEKHNKYFTKREYINPFNTYCIDLIKNKKFLNKNTFLKSKFHNSANLFRVTTAFLDQSSKIWKNGGEATVVNNTNINNIMLTKYNEIYQLKKIKLKQQSFFNLHPFTSFIRKQWPKITKSNKLKRHFKFALADICLPFKNQTHITKKLLPLKLSNMKINLNNYNLNISNINFLGQMWSSQTDPYEAESKKNTGAFQNNKNTKKNGNGNKTDTINKSLNFPLSKDNKQNLSIFQDSCFSIFDLKYINTKIYNNVYSTALLVPIYMSLLNRESVKTFATNSFFSTYEPYLFKKLSTNSNLNIGCLQINSTLIDLKKKISTVNFKNQTLDAFKFSRLRENPEVSKFFSYKQELCQNWIYRIQSPQIGNRLKKIPRRIVINHIYDNLQTTCKLNDFNVKIDKEVVMKKNIILLKNQNHNLVSNEKKDYNFLETLPRESSFQKYKICRLDTSFFVLIFYTMFFEKIQHQKITLNTIKIFMPYKSIILSHFLLSQGKTYGFSCKNFEILIYNKFQNFL